jgi:glutamate-1-semialdehyde 2,1-aminomutase
MDFSLSADQRELKEAATDSGRRELDQDQANTGNRRGSGRPRPVPASAPRSVSRLNTESPMQQTAAPGPTTTNAEQFASIQEVIAGGVSSSMRAQAIPRPLVVKRAKGARIWDVEDRELIDLNMGYGPHLFGYADRELATALARQLTEGAMTGLPHRLDRQAGELIARLVPSVEQVRFANSGTEAVTSALRLARAATGRTLVLTFEGHYHGWSETVLRAGKATFHEQAPDSTAPRPGAPGMIPGALAHTLEVPWNDLSALRAVFEAHGERLAAVICEPVMANACVVPPNPGQLEELRALCDRWGAWLIFDEVITGFRVATGGAQERYGVRPDLTVLSKVMGGGVPVAAFGGSRTAMAMLADQRALHLGVYAGNHLSVRAVVAMLEKIERSPEIYEQLEKHGDYLEHQLRSMFAEMKRLALVSRVGSLLSVSLLRRSVDLSRGPRAAAQAMDYAGQRALQIRAQGKGLYFHPSPIEPWFLSTAHSMEDLDHVVDVVRDSLADVPESR